MEKFSGPNTQADQETRTADQSEGGRTVGVDPTVVTGSDARKLVDKIKKKGGTTLKPVSENLIDLVWGTDKPGRPNEKIKSLDVQFAGKKFEEKLADLRKELEKKKSEGMIVSMLDEIAWLFNLRGNDIDYNPVFFSYALVTATDATLFIDDTKITSEVKAFLGDSVKIKPYSAIFNELKVLKESIESTAKETAPRKKYLISNKASWALSEGLGGEENVEEVRSPIGDSKAVKNSTELEGMRACHIRDGAALSQYFAWLENELINNKASIDEVTAADKLEAIRSKHDRFVGLSFDTISSTGANAAVIHYKPEKGSCATIDLNAIYLCDSGAQYLDGTTDTTRTLHFGNPTEAERESYTLVLKGHIALEQIRFPKGVSGFALDTLARQFLWAQGLDYRHGTGHGVGSYLNVHEGPVGIGTRVQYSEVPLAVGNVLSNEPGFYEDGSYGIRIENIIMVKEVEVKHKWGDKPFLGFEHVTMVPMCRKLTDVSLLSESDKKWLNEYHAEVLEKTQSFFKDDKLTMDWLERETQPY